MKYKNIGVHTTEVELMTLLSYNSQMLLLLYLFYFLLHPIDNTLVVQGLKKCIALQQFTVDSPPSPKPPPPPHTHTHPPPPPPHIHTHTHTPSWDLKFRVRMLFQTRIYKTQLCNHFVILDAVMRTQM